MVKRDPIEQTDEYKTIEKELEAKIADELKGVTRTRGYNRKYWRVKSEILKNEYSMEWKSPAVLNPRIKFD
jgi:hypothetical protein